MNKEQKTLAQKSKRAIESIHVAMLHVFLRGHYKPMSNSGLSLRKALLQLQPEIYGTISNDKKFELDGLIYVLERLPEGIESCKYINLISDEGLNNGQFEKIIPLKRRRNCYRVGQDQMFIEITRGKSDVYDILTHLTFMYLESHKLLHKILVDFKNEFSHEWLKLEAYVLSGKEGTDAEKEILFLYLSHFLGRSFEEVKHYYHKFSIANSPDRFFHIIYGLGKFAAQEKMKTSFRSIDFSDTLIEEVGHHIYGNKWANQVKKVLDEKMLIDRDIHIISANMHSVMNVLYAKLALNFKGNDDFELFESLSDDHHKDKRVLVKQFAQKHGLIFIKDVSGANINVQIIDTADLPNASNTKNHPVIIVMDYAFGEQAYETMDELLKPYKKESEKINLAIKSISIMGKAGILCGNKGDIMIPDTHIIEGAADNYVFENDLESNAFKNLPLSTYEGNMITVLGTSLQNKYILQYFKESSWNAIGLEMEGAHYQRAIQVASKVRKHISSDVKVRYAYYASDNPLHSGSTLASGGLGTKGVVPTYAITKAILDKIIEA